MSLPSSPTTSPKVWLLACSVLPRATHRYKASSGVSPSRLDHPSCVEGSDARQVPPVNHISADWQLPAGLSSHPLRYLGHFPPELRILLGLDK